MVGNDALRTVEAALLKIKETRKARQEAINGIHGSDGARKSLSYKIHDPETAIKKTEEIRESRKDAILRVAGSVGARKSL